MNMLKQADKLGSSQIKSHGQKSSIYLLRVCKVKSNTAIHETPLHVFVKSRCHA